MNKQKIYDDGTYFIEMTDTVYRLMKRDGAATNFSPQHIGEYDEFRSAFESIAERRIVEID